MRPSTIRALRTAAVGLALVACSSDRVLGPSAPFHTPVSAQFAVAASMPPVRIAEFHYDNAGTDAGEKIEISAPAGTDLTNWQIVRYNGNVPAAGVPYTSPAGPTIGGIIPATCGARGVLVFSYPQDGLQNGGNDGFALLDASGQVVEFLSYEGAMTASAGPAAGLTSVDVGVSEPGTAAGSPVGTSIQRQPDGSWIVTPGVNTFDACNDDTGVVTPPATVASIVVAPASASIAQSATQQFTATAYDAANQPIPNTTFTWASSASAIATVNSAGLATGTAPGDAQITATSGTVVGSATLHVNPSGPVIVPNIRFSEIHYDNGGTDVGEAIEVEGPIGADVTGWSIALYDGNGGALYNTTTLSGTLQGTCNTRGVVSVSIAGIQNGSPDGFALVDQNGVVVEFLSYEGAFTATGGPANGVLSTNIGTSEAGTENAGLSLQRSANGASWSTPTASTFGSVNGCGGPPPPPPLSVTFSGRSPTADPPLPIGFEAQVFATERNGTTVVPTTFSWTSETPAIASVDQEGVLRALSAGTAVLRATAADGTTATYSLPTVAAQQSSAPYGGNTEFGDPTDADPSDDFIIRRAEYTSSFNKNLGRPNWVSSKLDATAYGAQDRCNCFTFDPELVAAGFTPYTTADYTGAGAFAGYGIDRGHLTRSADRTASDLDNARTFYFSNVMPQAANVNQGPWAIMENFLGDFAKNQGKEVYVIDGGSGSKGSVKGQGKIDIPSQNWKVAVIMDHGKGLADVHSPSDVQVIAIIMPNDPGVNTDWTTYKTTVDAVEALSGYDLLSALPDNIERAVESNDQPPVATVTGATSGNEGSLLSFDASASSDPDAGDVLTYAWTFGDGGTATGATPSHAFADNGVHTVTVTVTDAHGVTAQASMSVTIANVAPSATLVVPATAVEGSNVVISLSGGTDPSSVDATSLTYAFDCGNGAGFGAASPTSSATCATTDDGVRAIRAQVSDKDGATTIYTANVTVTNAAPVIAAFTTPTSAVAAQTSISAAVSFADPGSADTHTVLFTWGDGTTSSVDAGAGVTATAAHSYAAAGFYTIGVTVTDDEGASVSSTSSSLAVFDAMAGSVKGKGSIPDADGGNKGTEFDFDAGYDGNSALSAQFELQQGDALHLHSQSAEYLVISGAKVTLRGSGTLENGPAVGYFISGIDGKIAGTKDDRIRIKVWDLATGTVLYDTEPGVGELGPPATLVKSGSVKIKK